VKNNKTVDRIQAVWNKLGGEDGVNALLCGDLEIVKGKSVQFGKFINVTEVAPVEVHDEKFVAKEKFSISDDMEINLGRPPNKNFNEWFLSGDGKIEAPVDGCLPLRVADVVLFSESIWAIKKKFGGEQNVETTLAELHEMLKLHARGQVVDLKTSPGSVNIFFIKDINGILRSVTLRLAHPSLGPKEEPKWWEIGALSTNEEEEKDWCVGTRAFARARIFDRR
jgi:hypothetical protein